VEAVTSRPGQWLAKALFEGALILIGLLAAFALNQWQDARQHAARAEAMIVAIRAELQSNLERQREASTYNSDLVRRLKAIVDSGGTFIPADVYGNGGLFKLPRLTAAAWAAAQNGEILDEVPVDKILALARVYESQRYYLDATGALFETLYGAALTNSDYRRDGIEGAPQLAGVLSDFAGRGAQLVRDYEWVLGYLDGRPPPEPGSATGSATTEPPTTEPEATSAATKDRTGERP
jgi:type II secretory pathway pseudopilin PulG